jgi:hypothetical protein
MKFSSNKERMVSLIDYTSMEVSEILGYIKKYNKTVAKYERTLFEHKLELGHALLALEYKQSKQKFRRTLQSLTVKPVTSRKYMKYAENHHIVHECVTCQQADEKLRIEYPSQIPTQMNRTWNSYWSKLTNAHDAILAELEETGDHNKLEEALTEADDFITRLTRLRSNFLIPA